MFLHPFRCPDCGVECAAEDTYSSAIDGYDRCPSCHDDHTEAVARQDAARVYAHDLDAPHFLPEDFAV